LNEKVLTVSLLFDVVADTSQQVYVTNARWWHEGNWSIYCSTRRDCERDNIYACFKLLSVQISQRAHERLRHDVLFPLFGEVPSTENFSSCWHVRSTRNIAAFGYKQISRRTHEVARSAVNIFSKSCRYSL